MSPAQPSARWLPAVAAGGVLVVVLIAGLSGGSSGDASAGLTSTSGVASDVSVDSGPTVPPVTQSAVVMGSTDTAIVKSSLASTITVGSYGDDVKQVQQRLTDLGFAPGPVDGQFGAGTQQAVWAFKKLVGGLTFQQLAASDNASAVDNALWQQMQDPIVIQPRRPMGAGRRHVEIYLPLQVMVVFADDKPTLIAHIATGELDANGQPKQWCETTTYDTDADGSPLPEPVVKQECAYSKTPGGLFRFRRKVEGNRVGPLGGMYNPVYFNYGIAVHGAKNVPKEPASHGCVRINMDIAEYFPDLVKVGDAVYVWGHDGKEPEGYTRNESLPSFNQPDPSATTTTSTTTTSTTTIVPASTTTTKPPSTTTTTKPPTTSTTTPPTTTTTTTTAPPS
ncbi:MAG: L,D-transpeptidase family protein [Actinomycetota bacterium]